MAAGPGPPQIDPAPPYLQSHLVQRRFSRWAIASLVVSFGPLVVPRGAVWAFVLVGFAAVILGIVALRMIGRSNGQERGTWMAVVGIVLGAFFSILILVVHIITPPPVPMGSTADVSDGGIHSVTVVSVQFPVSRDGRPDPTSGTEYAVARVRICAGQSGSQTDVAGSFELEFPNGPISRPDTSLSVKKPALTSAGLRSNACTAGYLSYQIARGQSPNIIQYLYSLDNRRWTIPPSH